MVAAVLTRLGKLGLLIVATLALQAFTANKIWMEFRDNGRYRVYVNYTVPELREFREAYVEFSKKQEAERYYFDLLRGADFYVPDARSREFKNPEAKPEPW